MYATIHKKVNLSVLKSDTDAINVVVLHIAYYLKLQ